MARWEDMTDEEKSREITMALMAGVSINTETGEVK